jgi:hypothetical protein
MTPEEAEHARWLAELKRRDAERAHDRNDQIRKQHSEAAVSSGQTALRTAVLVNGGAAAASLAFVGGLVSQGRLSIDHIAPVANSLAWFAWGVFFAVAGMGAAYLANYTGSTLTDTYKRTWEYPYFEKGPRTPRWELFNTWSQGMALFMGLASIAFFIVGVITVKLAIAALGTPT